MLSHINNRKSVLGIFSIILFFFFVLGIVSGAIFFVKSQNPDTIISYFKEVCASLSSNQNKIDIVKAVTVENTLMGAIVIFCAFFKLGIVIPPVISLYKGFITGFSVAVSISAYNIRGAMLMSTVAIETALVILSLILCGAISMLGATTGDKKIKKFLIFFGIFLISIFCVAGLMRGGLTTTFMKFLYPKLS